jgi:O-antigen ligase
MNATPLQVNARANSALLVTGAAACAIVVGALAAWDPRVAAAACAGVIAIPVAILKPRLVVYLLVLTIFASAFTVGGLTLNRLAAPVAVIAVISQLFQSRLRLQPSRATLAAVTGYALLAFASLAWTVSVTSTLNSLASLAISLAYMGAFALLVGDRSDIRALFWVAAVCSIALGLWWAASYALGISRYANAAGDPNFIAALQVVALLMVLSLAADARTRGRRLGLYLAVAIIAGSIVATLSRGGLIALLVAVLLVALTPARLFFGSGRRKLGLVVAVGAGLTLLLAFAWTDLSSRFTQGLNEPGVGAGRGDLDLAAIHGFQERPILGFGFGGFQPSSIQLLRTTPGVQLAVHLRCLAPNAAEYLRSAGTFCTGQPVHDAYLESLAELGIPGLLLFLGILGTTGFSLVRTARLASREGDAFIASAAVALAVGLAALAVASFALSTETSRETWMIVGLSLALPGMLRMSRSISKGEE